MPGVWIRTHRLARWPAAGPPVAAGAGGGRSRRVGAAPHQPVQQPVQPAAVAGRVSRHGLPRRDWAQRARGGGGHRRRRHPAGHRRFLAVAHPPQWWPWGPSSPARARAVTCQIEEHAQGVQAPDRTGRAVHAWPIRVRGCRASGWHSLRAGRPVWRLTVQKVLTASNGACSSWKTASTCMRSPDLPPSQHTACCPNQTLVA
mmetsp:Transcript_25051/g.80988  ORF Transcript_25051/g.80988 Transcript_25051/m.80988 type:complete len:202 (-) Transcript_25051:133-738(-)